MEEQRIGVMYWNLFKGWLAGLWDGMFPRGLRRSNALPVMALIGLVVVPGVGYYLHLRGQFSSLKREIKGEKQGPPPTPAPRPGGLDAVVLSRPQSPGSNMVEFRSVTLLPGLGMDVLQITATVPDKGEVALLAAPTVEQMANSPGGAGPLGAGFGGENTEQNDTRGAIEAPWSGLLTGLLSPVGTSLRATWKGHAVEAPTVAAGRAVSYGGMLSALAADDTATENRMEGPAGVARFKGTSFDEHWVSRTDLSVTVGLGPRTIDLTVTAKNVGDQPEPMGMGWHPRFLLPSGDRDAAEVRMPSGEMLEIADQAKGLPSGRVVPASAPLARFQGHPAALGGGSVDVTLVNPKPALMDSGAEAEVRDPASGLGLKMRAVSSNIRAFRVTSAAGSKTVMVGTQTNLDDPLGKEWSGGEPAITTLMPGQTVEWKVRLEIFSITKK